MMMKNFTDSSVHGYLSEVAKSIPHLRDLMGDPSRNAMVAHSAYLSFDYSKQRLNKAVLDSFQTMLAELKFDEWRLRYFNGDKINNTEGRAVLHTALRASPESSIIIDGYNIIPQIIAEREVMFAVAERIRQDASIKNVIALGIGGSDLGPRFVYDAFQDVASGPKIHYVSNVDGLDLARALKASSPTNTIFIVASKTFTTVETMLNAASARAWAGDDLSRFYAVTASPEGAQSWGVLPQNILPFADFVGGRFSVCSSIGFSLAIAFGVEFFQKFLHGAQQADNDFKQQNFYSNIPVLMAVCGLWNRNYLGYQNHLMAPYDMRLRLIAKYIQQMDMESNGKSVDRDGVTVTYKTAPHIYGEAGTDCQHSYMQLIHQGSDILPVDFIGIESPSHNLDPLHHKILLANMRAQATSLAIGQTLNEAAGDPFKVFDGNRPSHSFMLKELTPEALGYLIACYEHKIFTQGIWWNLNSYDQPGVELGKIMAKKEMK